MIIYAATLVAAGLALDLIWWYATNNRRLVNPDMKVEFIAFVHRRVLLAPILYLVAIGVSFVSIPMAKLLFLAVADMHKKVVALFDHGNSVRHAFPEEACS